VNYFLERRNYDFEQSSSCITELLLLLLRQLLLRRATYMVTDIVELLSVAVKLSLPSHAIKLSLPSLLLSLFLQSLQHKEHWGSDKAIFRDNT